MYYNPSTKEIRTKEEVKLIVNASFPDNTLEIDGWYLIDETSLYPYIDEYHVAVQSGIEYNEGRWARTYAVKPLSISNSDSLDASNIAASDYIELQKKYSILEKAVSDLGQIVSNLEMYRLLAESKPAD